MRNPAPTTPLYLHALLPSPKDEVDTVANEKPANEDDTPDNSQSSSSQEAAQKSESEEAVGGERALGTRDGLPGGSETYENPFLKPPKRMKLKQL